MVDSARYPPEIVIIVEDETLPLSEMESFSSEYIYTMGSPVTITRRWGGPAASGHEIEIAVAVMAGQLLRQVASDAYELAKRHIAALYRKINPDSGARFYADAAMALVTESDNGSVILKFCFPPGLTDAEVLERWHSVERNWRRLGDEWSQRAREEGIRNIGGVRLVRDYGNQYDQNAIGVRGSAGLLGYVPRTEAPLLAPLIDAGAELAGTVVAMDRSQSSPRWE